MAQRETAPDSAARRVAGRLIGGLIVAGAVVAVVVTLLQWETRPQTDTRRCGPTSSASHPR